MGVQGLWQVISSTGRPVTLESLENQILAVDVSIWMNQALRGVRDRRGITVTDAHLLFLFTRICKLLHYRIKPIFVFDGPAPALKQRVLERRRNLREAADSKAEKLRKKLLQTLVQQEVVNKAVKERRSVSNNASPSKPSSSSVPECLPSTSNGSASKNKDMYLLPPVIIDESEEAVMSRYFEPESSESDEPTISVANSIDLDNLDITSPDFLSLPPEIRHELLVELQARKKRPSWHAVDRLPEESDKFSTFQIRRLLNRSAIQKSLSQTAREMNSRRTTAVAVKLNEEVNSESHEVETRRIAADEDVHFVYAKKRKLNSQYSTESQSFTDSLMALSAEIDFDDSGVGLNGTRSQNSAETSAARSLSKNDTSSDIEVVEDEMDIQVTLVGSSKDVAVSDGKDASGKRRSGRQFAATIAAASPEKTASNGKSTNEVTATVGKANCTQREVTKVSSPTRKSDAVVVDLVSSKSVEIIEIPAVIQPTGLSKLPSGQPITPDKQQKATEAPKTPAKSSASLFNKIASQMIVKPPSIEKRKDQPVASPIKPQSPANSSKTSNSSAPVVLEASSSDDDFVEVSDGEPESTHSNANDVSSLQPVSPVKPPLAPSDFLVVLDSSDDEEPVEKPHSPVEESPSIHAVIDEDENDAIIQAEMESFAADLENLQNNLQQQTSQLRADKNREERLATSVSDQMRNEFQELIQLFGIPYVLSPGEAEAQCAYLDLTGQCHGTITDDSDIWPFGGKTVYRNFFNQKKHVEKFTAADIERQLGLNREKIIALSMLTGSDYTEGVEEVGCVRGLEILGEFGGGAMESLEKFRTWWDQAQERKKNGDYRPESKLRSSLMNLVLPDGFPEKIIVDAYLEPDVDLSKEKFTWGIPALDLLRDFTAKRFGWSKQKLDDTLLPIIKRISARESQTKLDSYFKYQLKPAPVVRSRRVDRALKRLKSSDSLEKD